MLLFFVADRGPARGRERKEGGEERRGAIERDRVRQESMYHSKALRKSKNFAA